MKMLVTWTALLLCLTARAQENPVIINNTEQQMEDLTAGNDDNETEDDTWLQQLDDLRKHPVNLNTAGEEELKLLRLLTPLQINNLFVYRRLFGPLVHIYELQAVPGWDVETIRKLLPFITVSNVQGFTESLTLRLRGGEHSLLGRVSQTLERQKGFVDSTSTGNFYPGSRQRILLRHRYTYKNLLQYGFTAEKDPGEQLFKGAQKNGFDFYSGHFFLSRLGKIKSLALGDFTVNLGQGLFQWQNIAFRKSADAMAVKRSAPALRPYNSAGEFNFFRGAGVTLMLGKHAELTVFGSYRLRDGNLNADTAQNTEDFISSLLTSGYHRTKSEIADRNSVRQMAYGGNISFRKNRWHAGINAVQFRFSQPLQKAAEPYNNFAISGRNWGNYSIDYSYTYRNFHYFGEAAIDKNGHYAFLDGILLSLSPQVDMSMVLRNISKKYQSLFGNAFTESTFPVNESGFYTGLTMRPAAGLRIDAYADFYSFPFLRFRTDAPSRGRDFLVQATYKPNKQLEMYVRYRAENKAQNISGLELPLRPVTGLPRQNLRTHISYKLSPAVQLRQRFETVWFDKKGSQASTGFLAYADVIYKPLMKPLSGNLRLQYFETGDYNSRIYAFENDVLYSFSIPVFYDKGWRYYLNLNYDLNRKISLWLRWSQTIYMNKQLIGSGLDEIQGSRRSDFRLQARVII
jgi:Helix-hairpin-helix motif